MMRLPVPAYACGLAMSIAAAHLPTASLAHAIVVKSSLTVRPVKPGVAGHITLYFNSRIEVKLSRAVLVSRDQADRDLVMVAGKGAGEVMIETLRFRSHRDEVSLCRFKGWLLSSTISWAG